MLRWSICVLILCTLSCAKAPETEASLVRSLDLNGMTANLRIAFANAANATSAKQLSMLSDIRMGPCSDTARKLWVHPFSLDLNALGNSATWKLGDVSVPTGSYEYLSLKVDDAAHIISMPAVKIQSGLQYVLIIAIDPVRNTNFLKFLAQVENGSISKVIYMDLNGHLATALPDRSACAAHSLCGNGVLDAGEECDDGNRNNNDGCSSDCKLETGFPWCHWQCDDPVCPAVCDPVCQPPHCVTHCSLSASPTNCVCHGQAPKPECEIRCGSDGCEMDGCPTCTTQCQTPTGGTVTCDQIDPNGPTCDQLPTLTCDVRCESVQCNWKCIKPNCPEPKCVLSCDSAPAGECSND